MENTSKIKPPAWFWVVSVLALLWNLMGAGSYLADAYISIEALEEMTQAQRELYESRPAWVTAAFAIAVWGGVLGCIALLMKKKWARPVLLISLLAVIAQQVYNFFISNTLEVYGNESIYWAIVILAISIALVYFARIAQNKGWIS